MKSSILAGILILSTLLAACQSSEPPTMLVMEVTRMVTVVVAPEDITATAVAEASSAANVTRTPIDVAAATVEADVTASPTSNVTPTPDVFPTAVVGDIYLASQTFERGNMYWVQPVNQIWVTTTDVDGTNTWRVYEDTFEDGMPESDPELVAPEGLFQPIRGFGKLWRDNPDLRTDLGWATDGETGYNTRYEYTAGGEVTEDFEYVAAPGYHLIETNFGTLRFDEGERTWELE
ncbi:MAG: hypothetical protein ACPG7F_07635 [Aggregatilineales bacterium]